MEKERAKRISKFLSLVLRHEPSAAGLTLDAQGWVEVDKLIAGAARRGFLFTRDEVDEVVRTNDKQRFVLSLDGQQIRAKPKSVFRPFTREKSPLYNVDALNSRVAKPYRATTISHPTNRVN